MLPIFYFKYINLFKLYMKKIIGIFYNAYFNEESFETGCGGAETWVIQISKEFSRKGYHVIVFSQYDDWFFFNSGVEYVPIYLFESRIQYQHFDYFIFVRSLDESYDMLVQYNDCRNIYVQSHDQFIWKDGLYNEKFNYNINNRFDKVKKYIALTEFHKEELMKFNNIPEDKIEIIGNGLDSEIFNEVDKLQKPKIDHSILWTSAFGRGGDILIECIMPLVRKIIPDFEVHICGYGDGVPDDIKNNPNVRFLGTLSKEDYYKEFRKHACWFLPCVVVEDFGICAGEAAMCECDIISPFKHGMKDVCWPFISLKMNNEFNIIETDDYHYSTYQLDMYEEDFNRTCEEAAYKIVNSIMNYYNSGNIKIRRIFKDFIMKEHTWDKVTNKWINIFK